MLDIENSNNDAHLKDVVFVFKKEILLMPRWQENASYKSVRLYIKITWPDECGGEVMFVISFHEDDI